MKIFVTGGYGFIGSCFIRKIMTDMNVEVFNLDKLTYAANVSALLEVENKKTYTFLKGDICDRELISNAMMQFEPDIVINFAAETHVDNSINSSTNFINTNILGTYSLLEASRLYYGELSGKKPFKYIQVSTDEVYGSLGSTGSFNECSRYEPNSPYSASKASSDHLCRAWHKTYGLPTVITNCSNNYGPYQNKEKFIPMIISNAMQHKPITIYGNGEQIRDWLHVEDHVIGLQKVIKVAEPGSNYMFGGGNELTNIDLAKLICRLLDEIKPRAKEPNFTYLDLIKFVEDRPGHDCRYAVDFSKAKRELNWVPTVEFKVGLRDTIKYYLKNILGVYS